MKMSTAWNHQARREKFVCQLLMKKKPFLIHFNEICLKLAILTSVFIQEPVLVPSKSIQSLPATTSSCYHPRYKDLFPDQLSNECECVFKEDLGITSVEAEYLLECTILQHQSLVWHEHHKGHLTASRLEKIFKAKLESLSHSLVTTILEKSLVSSAAIQRGIGNEEHVRWQYDIAMHESHEVFQIKQTGLHINLANPHIGASPDGIVLC